MKPALPRIKMFFNKDLIDKKTGFAHIKTGSAFNNANILIYIFLPNYSVSAWTFKGLKNHIYLDIQPKIVHAIID